MKTPESDPRDDTRVVLPPDAGAVTIRRIFALIWIDETEPRHMFFTSDNLESANTEAKVYTERDGWGELDDKYAYVVEVPGDAERIDEVER